MVQFLPANEHPPVCKTGGCLFAVKKIVSWHTQFVIFLFYMDLNVDFYFYI